MAAEHLGARNGKGTQIVRTLCLRPVHGGKGDKICLPRAADEPAEKNLRLTIAFSYCGKCTNRKRIIDGCCFLWSCYHLSNNKIDESK